MVLVEKHIIKPKHKTYDELDNLCWLSKNLYNSTLYNVRQYYFENKKLLTYQIINKMYVDTNNPDYRALPAKVAKHTQMLVEHNFKSFFGLIKLKSKGKYDKPVKIPKYLNKKTGRQVVHYEKGAISFKEQGYIKLSKTNIKIKTKLTKDKVQFVRLVPKNNYIVIEIGYNAQEKEIQLNDNVLAIDIGVNNIASCVTTNGDRFLINGKQLKYINHNYNKRIANIQSKLKLTHNKNKSRYKSNITNKRNNRINDYLHKITTYIVNQAVSNDITTIVVGYNKEWKQDTNIGKINNQNFVNIPYGKLRGKLIYLCKLYGIEFKLQEESYTSKASFFDGDEIPIYDKENLQEYIFSGKRIKRGLYQTSAGKLINADCNGALNILRKSKVVDLSILYNRGELNTHKRIRVV